MSDGTLEKVVENSWAKLVTRVVMPALLVALGTLFWSILSGIQSDLKAMPDRIDTKWNQLNAQLTSQIDDVRKAQNALARSQAEFNVKLGVLGEKVDTQGRQINQLEVHHP